MKIWTNLNSLAIEICKREQSNGREVNITEVKRVIRHLCDIIAEEWRRTFGLKLTSALRNAGQKRYRRNHKKKTSPQA